MRAPPDPGNANGAPTGAAAETALHDGQQLGSATQPAVQDRSLDEIGAEISSMLGVTDDDPRTRQRHLGICNANHKGGLCALCRRALDPTEPIWRVRVHIAYSFGGQPTYWLAPVCKQCRTDPTVNQWTISTKAYRCDGCGRPVYEARSYYRRALVACCDPCRHKAIALRAKRVRAALRGSRQCNSCGQRFKPKRNDARFCTVACKQKAYRDRVTDNETTPAARRKSRNGVAI